MTQLSASRSMAAAGDSLLTRIFLMVDTIINTQKAVQIAVARVITMLINKAEILMFFGPSC